jgi:hypothetical protein
MALGKSEVGHVGATYRERFDTQPEELHRAAIRTLNAHVRSLNATLST